MTTGLTVPTHGDGADEAPGAARMRFVIADDNAPFRGMVREVLQGCVTPRPGIVECGNGAEAVGAYDDTLPDWVIMDVEMPVMDGLEATRRIVGRHPGAKILVLTLHADDGCRAAAAQAGARAFLPKDRIDELCLSVTR